MALVSAPRISVPETVTIAALGAGGDGIVETPQGRVFVPYALPGETVEIEREGNRARLLRVVAASAERVAPPCPHFGICGGCSVQHLALPAYHAWKREIVATSLRLHGIAADVEAIIAGRAGNAPPRGASPRSTPPAA